MNFLSKNRGVQQCAKMPFLIVAHLAKQGCKKGVQKPLLFQSSRGICCTLFAPPTQTLPFLHRVFAPLKSLLKF